MNRLQTVNFKLLQRGLTSFGLNLCSVFSARMIEDSLPGFKLPANCRNLILMGNAGSTMWESMPEQYLERPHPVDEYTIESVSSLIDDQIPETCWELLYPLNSDTNVPLQQLGALAGWHHPSPLGIGINHRHGLWFAYRAVVALDAELLQADSVTIKTLAAYEQSPCLSCPDTPCLSACPANALELAESPDLHACVAHRCEPQSSCASTCLARQACPVAREDQYRDDQLNYFYDRSLLSVKRWLAK